MIRFSHSINEQLDKKLSDYQKVNGIKTRTKAINQILEIFFEREYDVKNPVELDKKLDRVLKAVTLNKRLTEQLFCNNGFRTNKKINEDEMLNNFYQDIHKTNFVFFD